LASSSSAFRPSVTAELAVREDFKTRGGVMHGRRLDGLRRQPRRHDRRMRTCARSSAPRRIESKTNFLAGIPIGDVAHAECVPLHVGRSTIVPQTRITRRDGKLAAVVTQTQIVMGKG
jgi:1,4-dihydroxy-2-naphthoyl-CoA hydrolase